MKTTIIHTPAGAIVKNLHDTDSANGNAIAARYRRAAKKLGCDPDAFRMIGKYGSVHTTRGSKASAIHAGRAAQWNNSPKPTGKARTIQSRCAKYLHQLAGGGSFLTKGWVKNIQASKYAKARAFGFFSLMAGPTNKLP